MYTNSAPFQGVQGTVFVPFQTLPFNTSANAVKHPLNAPAQGGFPARSAYPCRPHDRFFLPPHQLYAKKPYLKPFRAIYSCCPYHFPDPTKKAATQTPYTSMQQPMPFNQIKPRLNQLKHHLKPYAQIIKPKFNQLKPFAHFVLISLSTLNPSQSLYLSGFQLSFHSLSYCTFRFSAHTSTRLLSSVVLTISR